MFTYRLSLKNLFQIERIEGKEFFRNGQQQQSESDLSNIPSKITFSNRIGYFYSFGVVTQSNSSQSSNLQPRISSEQLFFARLARPIQQIFIRSIRSRGTEHPRTPSKEQVETRSDTNDHHDRPTHFPRKLIREI